MGNARLGNLWRPISPIAISTMWFGRSWKDKDLAWRPPPYDEIEEYLSACYFHLQKLDAALMIDTSPDHGQSEEIIGRYLHENPERIDDTFITTRWGSHYDLVKTWTTHNLGTLQDQYTTSASRLPKIDLLCMNYADERSIRDDLLTAAMQSLQNSQDMGMRKIGVVIKDAKALEAMILEGHHRRFDAAMIDDELFLKMPTQRKELKDTGIGIIVEARYRQDEKEMRRTYEALAFAGGYDILTINTRHNLQDTIELIKSLR